jgi:hypothetical protein
MGILLTETQRKINPKAAQRAGVSNVIITAIAAKVENWFLLLSI